MSHPESGPVMGNQRYAVLDALRGLALLGIALANFPEFGLWTFMSDTAQAQLPWAAADRIVRFQEYLFVDGKFYTIFSILFGIGFSIILSRHSVALFYRRMLVLFGIGLVHLLFIWNGDILLLYAVGGMLLPLVRNWSNRSLLLLAVVLLLVPVAIDAWQQWCGTDLAAPLFNAWWRQAGSSGISEENFASWLHDADSYAAMFEFLKQGAIERMWEFAEGHRLPKVLALFILGYLVGRNRLYARVDELRPKLTTVFRWTLTIGLPTSVLYAWSATMGHPWGRVAHAVLYAVSVVPLGVAYAMAVCLWTKPFLPLKWAGRMALSCYIGQSLVGILIFYGIGFGLGTQVGLTVIVMVAVATFGAEVLLCRLWLRYFHFGPLEWVWRMLTYGRVFRLRRS